MKTNPLIPGCNYHTTWQSHKAMRFVLHKVAGDTCWLKTRRTNKLFTTNTEDLIFIRTKYNLRKARFLRGTEKV